MRLRLDLAYIDDLKIHDVAALATSSYALRSARRVVEPRRVTRERTNRHGVRDDTKFYGGQTIDLAGYVDAPAGGAATEDAYDLLRATVALPGEHVFRFRRKGRTDEERIVFRQASGFDAPSEGDRETIIWACSLHAGDPRVYSAALKGASYDPTAALSGGGLDVPLTFPLTFTSTLDALLTVTNAGQFLTPPTFTIRGPVVDPIIDLLETGESIELDATLGANDVVVVDVAARTVSLNGAPRLDLIVSATTRWFELVRGTNRLRLRGSGMSTSTTRLEVAFRDARI